MTTRGREMAKAETKFQRRIVKEHDGLHCLSKEAEFLPFDDATISEIARRNELLTPEQVRAALNRGASVYTTFNRYRLEPAREALKSRPSVVFQSGFDDALSGRRYFCPSNGNRRAEDDYAIGFVAGEVAAKMAASARVEQPQ